MTAARRCDWTMRVWRRRLLPEPPARPLVYNPEHLVVDVLIVLAREGLRGAQVVDELAATESAATLLWALGVTPEGGDGG